VNPQDWEWLTAGAVEIVEAKHLQDRIARGERLRVKLGLDPTRPDIHLGHTVVLRTLRRFQQAGHTAVVIIGDTTAQIGDPSGQNVTRPQLTREDVEQAARTYLEQMWKLLDRNATEVRWQSEWFGEMGLADVVRLMSKYTVARMLAREDFSRRLADNRPIALHELLYPLLQAYDSVAVKADVELGGTDQTFNLLAGRDLQEAFGQPPQDILTVPLLEGLDGKQKMSKSLDNYIGVSESPHDMYWKAMAIPDSLIVRYLELVTDASPAEVRGARQALAEGANPRDVKKDLARRLVAQFHGEAAARGAEDEFLKTRDVPEITVPRGRQSLADLFVTAGLGASKSEIRRLVEQKGLFLDEEPVTSPDVDIEPRTGMVLRRGKRLAVRLRVA
jgi:tyrosyl-tRNA synthetase